LLDVAARSGDDAVHPGYGFLSENADFAPAVLDDRLTWIRPHSPSMRHAVDGCLKGARTMEESPALFESATREAVAAFGRGECFVERYLDRPRHVEAQVLADQHGNVVVMGTRDCSLQRRHKKLVEEAPAPFLTAEQTETLYRSSKDILRRAGYVGAGTCEF